MKSINITVIKEYVEGRNGYHCILRSDTYSCHLGFFDYLFETAQTYFSDLKKEDVSVVHYGGIQYKGTFGIEFMVTVKPPEEFFKRKGPELIL